MIKSKNRNYDIIERLCFEKGISIAQMCKEAGVRQGLISDLKAGKAGSLSADSIIKLSNYLNVSADVLLGIKRDRKDTITIKIKTDGMDEALNKAHELRDTLERAYEIVMVLGGANEQRNSNH